MNTKMKRNEHVSKILGLINSISKSTYRVEFEKRWMVVDRYKIWKDGVLIGDYNYDKIILVLYSIHNGAISMCSNNLVGEEIAYKINSAIRFWEDFLKREDAKSEISISGVKKFSDTDISKYEEIAVNSSQYPFNKAYVRIVAGIKLSFLVPMGSDFYVECVLVNKL